MENKHRKKLILPDDVIELIELIKTKTDIKNNSKVLRFALTYLLRVIEKNEKEA